MTAQFRLTIRLGCAGALALAFAAAPAVLQAQAPAPSAAPAATALPDPAKLDIRPLGPDAWVLIGQSGNVVIVKGPEGCLLIDDERARDAPEIISAYRHVAPGAVRYVVNTHWHLDHSGGNPVFAKLGAVIVAQREVRARRAVEQFMPAYNSHIPPAAPQDLPQVVFDDRLELHVGGETVRLVHAPRAHTDGDAIVWLERANAVHMGDVYFNGIWPFIDRASGGGIQGVIAAVDQVLAKADDKTTIIPAHGELASKAQLKAYRDMLVDVQAKVKAGIKAKKTLAQIVASKPALAYEKGMEGREEVFVEAIYDSLVKPH
ncbi:MAG: MBL fold metallo-hydrolase [Proteobacteria bacterium]|nr:MBL fold metallo-hydrolase [Pseudomonadota bacterium]